MRTENVRNDNLILVFDRDKSKIIFYLEIKIENDYIDILPESFLPL